MVGVTGLFQGGEERAGMEDEVRVVALRSEMVVPRAVDLGSDDVRLIGIRHVKERGVLNNLIGTGVIVLGIKRHAYMQHSSKMNNPFSCAAGCGNGHYERLHYFGPPR